MVTCYEFGRFRIEPAERRLRHGDTLVSLTPKAFDTLVALVSRAGHAVAKQELLDVVWPDAHVGEATLAQNVFALRKALGADAIETVPKYGYRFAAAVRAAGRVASPLCCLQWRKRQLPLERGENIIGRDPDVNVSLDASTVSRRHAKITITAVDARLEDLGSKNGTFIGGARLTGPARLDDGDEVGFGSLVLTFRSHPPLMTTETQPPGGSAR